MGSYAASPSPWCCWRPSGSTRRCARSAASPTGRLVVLAIALEEDAATDVARVYGLLEDVAHLRFWASGAEVPAPVSIEALPVQAGPGHPVMLAINVLEGARDLGDRCASDKYIGAWVVGVPADGETHDIRLRFLTPDQKNDWTALMTVRGHAQ